MLVNQVPCPLTEDPERSEAVPPIYCQLHWINYSGPSGRRGKERFIHKKETTWSSWKHISFLISINTPLSILTYMTPCSLFCQMWHLETYSGWAAQVSRWAPDIWIFFGFCLFFSSHLIPNLFRLSSSCDLQIYGDWIQMTVLRVHPLNLDLFHTFFFSMRYRIWILIPGGAVSRYMETDDSSTSTSS